MRRLGEYRTQAARVRQFVSMVRNRALRDLRRGGHGHEAPAQRVFRHEHAHVLFGYYDVTPFSRDDTLLLAMHAPLPLKTPSPGSAVKVGYYDLACKDTVFHEIGETTAWCWQQGCRLQWYPARDGDRILYNCLVDGSYGAVIRDIASDTAPVVLKRPLYAVSHDGRCGLSLNFSRLQRLRPGYGYTCLRDVTEGIEAPADDGIWRIDMETGEAILLVSLEDMSRREPLDGMAGAEHYFNHLLFTPDGSRFMFFHLWQREGKRRSRLATADIEGGAVRILDNVATSVSHYTWKNDHELLATTTHPAQGFHYALYDDSRQTKRIIGQGVLATDGHPTYLKDPRYLLTDTYPDRYRDQSLLLYDFERNSLTEIGRFHSPFRFYGEVRCDLHPRLSRSNASVCIDDVEKKQRVMRMLEITAHSDRR